MTEFKESEVSSSVTETLVEEKVEVSLDSPDEVTDLSSQLSGSNESAKSEEQDDALLSSEMNDLRDAVITADDSEDIKENPTQKQTATEVPTVDSKIRSTSGLVPVKLDDIVIDNSNYSREEVNSIIVSEYVEAFRNGANFPPPVLDKATEFSDKKVVVDGGHRITMYKRYRQDYPKFLEDYKKEVRELESEGSLDEPVPLCPPPAPDDILCRFEEKPKDIPLILWGYSYNKLHGVRPRPQDRIKTACAAYLANRGIPLTTLASYLGVSVKLVRRDIKKLVDEYEALKFGHIAKRGSEGATAAEIAAELAELYPYGKGLSESSVTRRLEELQEGLSGRPKKDKKKKADNGTGTSKKDQPTDPPYPPPASTGKPTGADGANTNKSVTSSSGVTSAPAQATKPTSATTSADTDHPAPSEGTGTTEGVSKKKSITGAADAPTSAAAPHSTEITTPAYVSDSITATDGSVVTIDDSGFSLLVNGLGQTVNIMPYDLWDFGSPILSVFVNLLYFFTNRGDQVVAVTPADDESFTAVCTNMDRKFASSKDDSAEKPDFIFVNPQTSGPSRPDSVVCLEIVRQILKQSLGETAPGARLALLCECWDGDLGQPVISIFDYADVINEIGWRPSRCIPVPRSISSITGKTLMKAVEKRLLANLGCYIVIAEKREGNETVPQLMDEVSPIPSQNVPVTGSDNLESPEADSQTQVAE
jgi:hypothetical protein